MASHKAHCLMIPYTSPGHINPMLQFSKRLQHEGIKVTVATTKFMYKTIKEILSSNSTPVETISDGFDEDGQPSPEKFAFYLETFQRVGSETLSDLVLKLQDLGSVDCIIYDAFLPWAVDVAVKFGIPGAAFYTESGAVNNIYYHVKKGSLELPISESEVKLPGLPVLATSDLPSFIADYGSFPPVFDLQVNQFLNVEKADWVFFNTFRELEDEAIDWISKLLPVRTIGPAIPSIYLDKRLQNDKEYGLNVFEPVTDTCITWLDERTDESVIYVSFGSLAQLTPEQMAELAWGLRNSNKHFLWVVKKSEKDKLPEGFLEETREKGLIVSWSPQLQVLAHRSVGCFVTHCGWNSSLEALSLGVPMVAVPIWLDQGTNAKFLTDSWKLGMKVRKEDSGLVTRDEIETCIREVMEGEKGKDFRANAIKWKELAAKAVDEGGSSDKNIKEFVSQLVLKC